VLNLILDVYNPYLYILAHSTNKMPRSKARSQQKRVVRARNRAQDQAIPLYKSLDTERREIRLVTVSPGHFADDIHCSLSKVSLNESPPYEALSYVWGAGGSRRHIFLDGLRTPVTRNLEIALRNLRHVSQSRVLWVDAICINQRDIPERNIQVIHMGDVYKSASRVIAWLGEEDEDSNLACDALESLPTDDQVHWDLLKNTTLEKAFLEPKYATAIGNLFRRPWWYRIWTVQESILGPSLLFICGRRQMSAAMLFALSQGYVKHSTSCCQDFFWKKVDYSYLEAMIVLYKLGLWRRRKFGSPLVNLLGSFTPRYCTDPRDKVYGLLGLCTADERKTIFPDYFIPVSLVYEQVTLKIIENSRSLDVFSQLRPRSLDIVKLATGNLPSWVPDWTLENTFDEVQILEVRQERIADYKASSGTSASVRYLEKGRIALKGIILGPVAVVSTPAPSTNFQEWRDMAGIETLPGRLYGSRTSTTYYDAYWETLCCSILPSRSSLHDPNQVVLTSDYSCYRSWHDAWWDWVSKFDGDVHKMDSVSSDYIGPEIAAFDASVIVATGMRRLFISRDEEWLGLVPSSANVGDVIVLLEGGSVPYILRLSEKEAGCYNLIGDAYVHGVMDGEGWKPDLLQELVLV
jgi:hypothetical protein